MSKTSPAQQTDSPQMDLFGGTGQVPPEHPQAGNSSPIRPSGAEQGVAEPNANSPRKDPMPEAAPTVPTESPAATDGGYAEGVFYLVELEAPRETPPIEELTHSSVQSETDGRSGIPAIGAGPDHLGAPDAVVNGYAPHAGDQKDRVPVTEAAESRTDAPREPEVADRLAVEARNGELPDEDGATKASAGATSPAVSPDPAALATAADSPESSGTNQPAGPDQPGTASNNGTAISSGASSKRSSPLKKMVPRRLIKVHPGVEVILRQTCLFDLWDEIWRKQTDPTKTKMALLTGAGVKALLAVTELRAIKAQGEYFCYSNTWIFRHLECILPPSQDIAVEVHAKVSREQLRQEVLNEYLLRPIYYRLPTERSFGLRLLASMRELADSGLFNKMTVRRFRHWTGFSTGSMSNQEEKP